MPDVIPSLPGFGFSRPVTDTGWDTARIATAWAELMRYPSALPGTLRQAPTDEAQDTQKEPRTTTAVTKIGDAMVH